MYRESVEDGDRASGEAARSSAPAGVSLTTVMSRCATAITRVFPQPVWVRIEISKISPSNGHLYVDVVERAPSDGSQLAKAKANIWSSKASTILTKFKAATGMDLAPGISILVLALPVMSAQYGFSLTISDIDPSYTLGDMEAKLQRIRKAIAAEGHADKNRLLPAPTDFFRVAVISPAGAAGLRDFEVGARVLTSAGLCEFEYFSAFFQGEHTAGSLCAAIDAAADAHERMPFDALAIIRGGGAASDLQWLAELSIVRHICCFPCPVFTGIGHETDKSILDDYSHRVFGTPSKVIAHIKDTIASKAQQGHEHWQTLTQIAISRLDNAQARIDTAKTIIATGILRQIDKSEATNEAAMTAVRSSANTRLDRASAASILADQSIATDAIAAVDLAEIKIAHRYATISDQAHVQLARAATTTDNAFQAITLAAQRSIEGIENHTQELLAGVRSSITSRVANYEAGMLRYAQDTRLRATQRLDQAERENQNLIAGIMAHGVEPTLRRGFALVRDANGPVSTKAKALASPELHIDFRDGSITVHSSHQPQLRS